MRLECKELTKIYFTTTAVDGLDLKLEPGRIYGLLGPNGSGKTTLMKIIAGLVIPTSGEVRYEDRRLDYRAKSEIAYMPPENYFFPYMRCIDAAKYYADFFADFSMDTFHEMMKEVEIDEKARCRELSTGMSAKLRIALTMSRRSWILLLDEPLNGIDLIARDKIMSVMIAHLDSETTVLLSSHLVDELEKIVDEVIFMKKGKKCMSGNAEELREKEKKSMADLYRSIYGGEREVLSDEEAFEV